jgi:hypothetical protein
MRLSAQPQADRDDRPDELERAGAGAARLSLAALVIVVIGFVLAGCALRLAPSYDRSIVDGLARANEETMTLFASLVSGVAKDTFAKREPIYDELVGRYDALRLQAQGRPAPQTSASAALFLGNDAQAQQRIADATAAPTPAILASLIRTMTMMRETDRKQGLQPIVVQNFKREFEISMQQALTYEKALER